MPLHFFIHLYGGGSGSVPVTGSSSDVPSVLVLSVSVTLCPLAGKLEPLSDDCHEEVMQLKIWRSKSLDSNPALGECRIRRPFNGCMALWRKIPLPNLID
jgi:hypothetical protein